MLPNAPATTLLVLGTAIIAAARSTNPVPKSVVLESWDAPARETVVTKHNAEPQVGLGWSPAPTPGPQPPWALMGRMLMPRQDSFSMGPRTCGYAPGTTNDAFTCISFGFTCTPQSGYIGCCAPGDGCSGIQTTCFDYAASKSSACDFVLDDRTLCCGTASAGACFTWIVHTAASTDDGPLSYTLLDCAASSGTRELLTYDPGWSLTHKFTSVATSGATSTTTTVFSSTSTVPTTSPTGGGGGGGGGGSSLPVGAIAGGAVGGVAAIGLVGIAAYLLIRRRPNNSNNSNNHNTDKPPESAPPGHLMNQLPQSPHGSAAYTPSVQGNYQYTALSPQPGFDPQQMGHFHQQGAYPPVYPGHQPQQGGFQGQYPPGQQPMYGYPAPSSSTSPPPHTTPSPGFMTDSSQTPLRELDAGTPKGAESNRAELG